jgi:hypothetical protein
MGAMFERRNGLQSAPPGPPVRGNAHESVAFDAATTATAAAGLSGPFD